MYTDRPNPSNANRQCDAKDPLRHDPLLTAAKAAEIIGVTSQYLIKHRTTEFSSIAAVRVGNALRFRTSSVFRFGAQKGGQPAPTLRGFDDEVVLNATDAAAYLGLAASTLAGWRYRDPEAGPPDLGLRSVRYRLSDLNRWVDRRSV